MTIVVSKTMGALAASEHWSPVTVGIALAAYQPNPVWFAEQLASIANQTYRSWTCVITLDSPLAEIHHHPDLAPFLADSRFTWIENQERLGIRLNFEKAIAITTGRGVDLIALCDQDDIWLPEKIEESVTAIKTFGPMSVVATDAYLFAGEQVLSETLNSLHRINRTTLSIAEIIIYPSVSGFTMLLDAQLAKRHPQIPASLRYQDHWLSVVATAYRGVKRLEKPLVFYRQHEKNSVGISMLRNEMGLPTIAPSTSTTGRVQALGRTQYEAARIAADQLPLGRVTRAMLKSHIGWIITLLFIIPRRSFSEKRLVVQAFRAVFAQLVMFSPQTENLKRLRACVPLSGRILKQSALAVLISVIGVAGLFSEVLTPLVLSSSVLFWMAVALGALLIPGWKLVQHLYPSVALMLIGLSALLAGTIRFVTDSVLLSVVAFAAPVAWYIAYRIRWRGDTGF